MSNILVDAHCYNCEYFKAGKVTDYCDLKKNTEVKPDDYCESWDPYSPDPDEDEEETE